MSEKYFGVEIFLDRNTILGPKKLWAQIVKLQSKVQISVFGLGVDFVLPLSQQEEE